MAAEETPSAVVAISVKLSSEGLVLQTSDGDVIPVFTREEVIDKLVEQSLPDLRKQMATLLDLVGKG